MFFFNTFESLLVKNGKEKKMKLNELLKANGIEDEQIEKIVAGMKENKIFTSAQENMDVRYPKLKSEYDELRTEIEELKGKAEKDVDYKAESEKLKQELAESRKESAVKLELLKAGVKDIDYMMFKANDLDIQIDKDGKIKGIDDVLDQLKTQFPSQFEHSQLKKVEENKLPKVPETPQITKEQFNRMSYHEKNELYNTNKKLYDELRGEENGNRND